MAQRFKTAVASAMGVLLTGALTGINTAEANEELARKRGCLACHALDRKLLGPSFKDIAAKYKDDDNAAKLLAGKVKNGGSGVWGSIPMPPSPNVSDEDIRALVVWILAR